ncbi:MAG: hypothetical protein KHZ15_01255 [Coprobacillus cateniformis]|uniref:hypothetical protein n=1 Tax=Longibaculum muris TaxID=1796628 RepID=UPI003AB73FF2|nr:hypothetical protein [Coprobacillus cateniformis]
MITLDVVKQIGEKLSLENSGLKDIINIVYYNDIFECGDTTIVHQHIDIEFSYGEYYEVCEGTSLFDDICVLCHISLLQREQEKIIIYEKTL